MSNEKMNPENNSGDKMPPRKNRQFFMMAITLISVILLMSLMGGDFNTEKISRTEFYGLMNDKSVLIQDLELQKTPDGVVVKGTQLLSGLEKTKEGEEGSIKNIEQSKKYFTTLLLSVADSTIHNWEANKGLKVEIKHDSSGWLNHLFTILPIFIIIGFFWFMMSRQSGPNGGRGIFNFGKSRAKLMDASKVPVTFRDVAGCDEAKEELTEVVDFLKDPKKYDALGAKIPKGALLLGPPGTGKTLLARAVAGEAKVPFYSMSGSDFVEMFVGVGASRVRDLFETGKKNAPCILFIDEIDAVGRQRGAGLGGGHDESEQTLNQLLVEMDGFEGNEGVILMAATNRADVLDKALLRPGRFDRHIVVDAPDAKGREEILKVHVRKRKTPLAEDVNLTVIAKGTPGLSGADIENLVNEASLMAARYNAKKVSMIDFEEAKDKLMIGAERRSRILTEEEKRTTAYHEAGHALVTHLVENSDTLHKLTIIPRGMALGITFSLPEKDRYTMDKAYLEDQIAILLGGRAAEMLIFGQRNTGASNDIQRATEIARRMVTEWGMTDELGPIHYAAKKSEPFLGRDISDKQEYSEETAIKIDRVIRQIIEAQMQRVDQILTENKEKLIALSEALLQHEVLDRDEILAVLDEGKTLDSTKKSRQYEQMAKVKELLATGGLSQEEKKSDYIPENLTPEALLKEENGSDLNEKA